MPKFISDEEVAKMESNFISDEEMAKMEQGPSQFESGLRGAAQGATMGFADELTGGAQALYDVATTDKPLSDLEQLYKQRRDESRTAYKSAEESNPATYLAGNIGGGIGAAFIPGLGALNAGKAASVLGRAGMAAGQGAIAGYGVSEKEAGDMGLISDMAKGGAIGGGASLGLDAAGKLILKGAEKLAPKLASKAEQFTRNFTGATRKQAESYKPGTERFLLDKGFVKFGQSQEDLAKAVSSAQDDAGKVIGEVIDELDKTGASVSQESIVAGLESKITEMKNNPALAPVVSKMQSMIDDIIATGEREILPSTAEEIKRSYNKVAGNWMNPEVGQAGKEVYRAYKTAVEDVAQSSPELASKFNQAKQTYGMLEPVREAAEKRALQLQQSPIGGLNDITSAVGGGIIGGVPGSVVAAGARRLVSPRIASSTAVVTDMASKTMQKLANSPKYSSILQSAANRGGNSVAATDFILSQTDPEYRKAKNGNED